MANKKAGPDLKIKMPELVICPDCNGKRLVKSLIYEMTCSRCEGLGKVDAETLEAVPIHIGYPALMKSIDRLRYQNKILSDLVPVDLNPYRGSGKYKGD